ncbi:type IV secretion system protein VirD4 [Pusillimonas sp. T7-7]|uniref:type IV secretion system DNA-binding domain-containing protein n=1 Tax=Pusillimonas sp. (strain T7-7) TaxID=1007105 RepID=UPI00020844A1|nr:type IV secretion system DNA-binding domain-containing protein [Pusillimonas sp. T7-7]AEC20328.1 type IV secretion system protein VirD4 [Pusillimonas sp. T7-7]NYT60573.1 type IV secretion system DNA-binding domain-containing protein [Alcaligenaceae bacterium]
MSTLISPITRRRIAAFSLALLPTGAWMAAATWGSHMHWRDWNTRTFWHFVMLTPQYPVLYGSLGIGLVLALVLILLIGRTARTEGFEGAAYKRFVRGTRTTSAKSLARQCQESGKQQIDVGGIPMPTANENLHLLISGATGSGKSVLLRNMAASVLKRSQHDMSNRLLGQTPERNDRMIVIDPNGDLLSKFWQPSDVILNPYDARSQGWAFFNEVRADYDWKRLAHSMVPMSQDNNAEEWNDFGRLLLRETARKLHQLQGDAASVMDLFRLCTIEDPKVLKQFLEGTLAESLFVGSSEASKALSSARFVLSNKLSEHTGMKPGRFSIRDWLVKPDGGNLYINWREDMMSSMKPLVSSWADVFITSILSRPESTHRRWWLFIDELASLEALPSLEAGLTKGRKNGLRIVAGLQSTSQLEHIYGRTMATTIRASFRNLAVLGGSRTDPQTAKDMSESLGKHEVERPKYSISRSVDHRNTSDNMDRTTEDVVTAAQIQSLPALGGYVALAGDFPIARVGLPFREFVVSAAAFQESGKALHTATSTTTPSNG